jgi:hypothetical protein
MHDRWAADATLNGLLPASRVWLLSYAAAGGERQIQDREPDYPYAVMFVDDDALLSRGNDGLEIRSIDVEIDVYASRERLAAGKAVVDRLASQAGPFNRAQFPLTGGGNVNNGIIQNFTDPDPIDDDGVMLFECPFTFTVQTN